MCRKATSYIFAAPGPIPRLTPASPTASRCPGCGSSNLSRLIEDEIELRPIGRDVALALRLAPPGAVVRREPSVALVVPMNFGHHEPCGERQRLGEEAAAADHEHDGLGGAQGKRRVQPACPGRPPRFLAPCARDHDMVSPTQQPAPRFPHAA